MEKLVSDVKSFIGFLTGVAKIANWFINILISIVNAIRNLLPV
jgi:hypothetical protein